MQINVTIPEDQVKHLEDTLGRQSTKQAIYQAVKRTVRAGAVIIRKRVQEELAISNKWINRVVTSSVIGGELATAGKIIIKQEQVPLANYGSSLFSDGSTAFGITGGRGVTVVISKNRPPLYLKHAFFAKVGTGAIPHKGIFMRAKGRDKSGGKQLVGTYKHLKVGKYIGGKLTPRGYAQRLPIEEQFGPSIVDAYGPEKISTIGEAINRDIAIALEKNMNSQIDRFTGRRKGEVITPDAGGDADV